MTTRTAASRIQTLMSGPPLTWLLAGDSITQAHNGSDGRRGYADLFSEYLRGHLHLERVKDACINSGVSGSTVSDALPEFNWRIGRFAPDIVSIAFGMNDAEGGEGGVGHFAFDLHQLVGRSLDLGAAVVIHTPYPVGPLGDPQRSALAAYAEAIRRLAADQGLLLVDHYAHWQSIPASQGWYLDPIHANARGHVEMARLFTQVMGFDGDTWLDDLAARLDTPS